MRLAAAHSLGQAAARRMRYADPIVKY